MAPPVNWFQWHTIFFYDTAYSYHVCLTGGLSLSPPPCSSSSFLPHVSCHWIIIILRPFSEQYLSFRFVFQAMNSPDPGFIYSEIPTARASDDEPQSVVWTNMKKKNWQMGSMRHTIATFSNPVESITFFWLTHLSTISIVGEETK